MTVDGFRRAFSAAIDLEDFETVMVTALASAKQTTLKRGD